MSTRLVGQCPAGTQQRPWLGAWALIVLFLHAACATGVPHARSFTAEAETEVDGEVVRLSLPTRFGTVRVSDFELNEALTTLVLNMPLRVAGSRFPLYLHCKLALARPAHGRGVAHTPGAVLRELLRAARHAG